MGQRPLPLYAANIQRLARASGMTQARIAWRAGICRGTFIRYHNGVRVPPEDKVVTLARVFAVQPSDIMPELAYLDDPDAVAAEEPQNDIVASLLPDLAPDLAPDFEQDNGATRAAEVAQGWSASASTVPGVIRLQASVDLPANVAAQIVCLLAQGAAR